MGRGSLIGISGIVLDNEFGYQGIVKSAKTAYVLQISDELINLMSRANKHLKVGLENEKIRLDTVGIPQIDYLICK